MNQRKSKMEKLMLQRDDARVDALFDLMLGYFKILDVDIGTVHSKVFKALYFDKRRSYEKIANDNFLSVDTLVRYIRRYDNLAENLLKNDDILKHK